jgi:hypothetical protein
LKKLGGDEDASLFSPAFGEEEKGTFYNDKNWWLRWKFNPKIDRTLQLANWSNLQFW